jgi:hypothetical protein
VPDLALSLESRDPSGPTARRSLSAIGSMSISIDIVPAGELGLFVSPEDRQRGGDDYLRVLEDLESVRIACSS